MRLPDPVWPVVALALVQLVDAFFCVRPVGFVRRCLTNVGFPRRYWRLLTPVKLAAAAGLLLGIVVPYLGLVTSSALVVYFVVAIAMHVRRRDLGRDLFLNATGMLLICVAVTWWSFLR
ncbi:DoxX family protein [Micromonospora sp. WMMD1102]|uniref:DoxX family protein n=1 Tax=Micromonospora sp. WMMD1102 TaxID=3016105 RepID=UPI00241520AF|nr:DoxX family protein [Micromonospora sp. WMMD1102]MDG4788623.1 DoxX family protein [Micromonospora sp. WMMD1102]